MESLSEIVNKFEDDIIFETEENITPYIAREGVRVELLDLVEVERKLVQMVDGDVMRLDQINMRIVAGYMIFNYGSMDAANAWSYVVRRALLSPYLPVQAKMSLVKFR